MWNDIKAIYRDAGAFSRFAPLLFLIPVLVEMAQHVVELRAGMYVDEASAGIAERDPLRLWFGFAKTLALLLPGYWFVRYALFAYKRRAVRAEWPAVGLFAVIFAFGAVQSWWSLFGPGLVASTGLTGQPATIAGWALATIGQAAMIYLTAWMVAWPLGNARIGPLRSIAVMRGSFWYTVGLMVAAILPLMVLHYALAIAAVVALPGWLDWAAMIVDSLVVGWLALTLAGALAYATRRAAGRHGVTLLPDHSPEARDDTL